MSRFPRPTSPTTTNSTPSTKPISPETFRRGSLSAWPPSCGAAISRCKRSPHATSFKGREGKKGLTGFESVNILNAVKELPLGVKERKARQKKFLRQEILDAASELFVKEGYENVSMRRIADKIEYSPTTIYLYFEDKASLLFAVCEETFAKLAKRMESITRQNDDPITALKRGCRAYVEFGLKYPNHYRVTFINHPELHLGREHYLREGSMGMRCYSHLRANVQACIREGRFKH